MQRRFERSRKGTGSVIFVGPLGENKGKKPVKKQVQLPHLKMGKLQYTTFLFLG